jgi:hypothetical protein
MAGLPRPTVRTIVACERIVTDLANTTRVNLFGVMSFLRPLFGSGYPVRHPVISVFAQVTECRGRAKVGVEIRHEETGHLVIRTRERIVAFPNDPLLLYGFRFRMLGCVFPLPGLYRIILTYDGDPLAETALILRSTSPNIEF